MIIDSHEHVMLPTTMQIHTLDEAGVDKAILFTTTPHIERAKSSTLEDINNEMQTLYKVLAGYYTPQERIAKMKETIAELQQAISVVPDRFYGFGPVPLGLTENETSDWVDTYVIKNSFKGIGEFTPGSEDQVKQLEGAYLQSRNTKWNQHTHEPMRKVPFSSCYLWTPRWLKLDGCHCFCKGSRKCISGLIGSIYLYFGKNCFNRAARAVFI